MYGKKQPGKMYAGGTPNFSEATGSYRQPPRQGIAKPQSQSQSPMSKPQARMQAMKKRMGM